MFAMRGSYRRSSQGIIPVFAQWKWVMIKGNVFHVNCGGD